MDLCNDGVGDQAAEEALLWGQERIATSVLEAGFLCERLSFRALFTAVLLEGIAVSISPVSPSTHESAIPGPQPTLPVRARTPREHVARGIDHERERCGDAGGAAVRGGGADRQAAVGQELSHARPLLHCSQGGAGVDVLHRLIALVQPRQFELFSSHHHIAKPHPALAALACTSITTQERSHLTIVGHGGCDGGAHSMAGRAIAGTQVQAPQGDAPVRQRLAAADSLLFRAACVVGNAGTPPATSSAGRGRSAACQAVALAARGSVDQWGLVGAAHFVWRGWVGEGCIVSSAVIRLAQQNHSAAMTSSSTAASDPR